LGSVERLNRGIGGQRGTIARLGWSRELVGGEREVEEEAEGGRWSRSGESAPERLNPERSRAVTWRREESHKYP
jgi:hypothetical protein